MASYQLYYHPASSASMRVTLYLACRGVPGDYVELVSTDLQTDSRGILAFNLREGDPVARQLGTTELTAFNPEGRVPVLLLPDGRKMTQTGAIIDFLESGLTDGQPLLPAGRWARAEALRIAWIVAADIQPYQNIPFIIQAMGEWGMVRETPPMHPLRLHFIHREFSAIEGILEGCAGDFAVGNDITLADCFLVPQVRNALLSKIDLEGRYPVLNRVFENMLADERVKKVIDEAGGVVQPIVFDDDKFQDYAEKN